MIFRILLFFLLRGDALDGKMKINRLPLQSPSPTPYMSRIDSLKRFHSYEAQE